MTSKRANKQSLHVVIPIKSFLINEANAIVTLPADIKTNVSFTQKKLPTSLKAIVQDVIKPGDAILDLGCSNTSVSNALARQRNDYFALNLSKVIANLEPKDRNFKSLLERQLTLSPPKRKCRAVLCWDLLNYLELNSITILFAVLAPFFEKDTVLHLLQYSNEKIPGTPASFSFSQNLEVLVSDTATSNTIAKKDYTHFSFLRSLDPFQPVTPQEENDELKSNGMFTEMVYLYKVRRSRTDIYRTDRYASVDEEPAPGLKIELPLLNSFLESNLNTSKSVIMEIGKKSGNNSGFLQAHTKTLFIEDIFSSIVWQRKLRNSAQGITSHLLKLRNPNSFDAVLAWDLFNFCTTGQIRDLGEKLSNKMNRGSQIHCIVLGKDQIPNKPVNFKIEDPGQVFASGLVNDENERPFTKATDLLDLLPKFTMIRIYQGVSSNGIRYQELILSRK
jgi:hypothetical protein